MAGPVYPYRDRRADGFDPSLGLRRSLTQTMRIAAARVLDPAFERRMQRIDAKLRYAKQQAQPEPFAWWPDDFRDFYIDRNPDFDTTELRDRHAKRKAESAWPGPMYAPPVETQAITKHVEFIDGRPRIKRCPPA